MTKVLEYRIGDLRGIISQYKDGANGIGYGYKIYYKLIKKSQLLGQSYVALYDKKLCYDRMVAEMKVLAEMQKDLFDLEKL